MILPSLQTRLLANKRLQRQISAELLIGEIIVTEPGNIRDVLAENHLQADVVAAAALPQEDVLDLAIYPAAVVAGAVRRLLFSKFR